jgi:hypothetical protein
MGVTFLAADNGPDNHHQRKQLVVAALFLWCVMVCGAAALVSESSGRSVKTPVPFCCPGVVVLGTATVRV